jgi:hypothetical protein
MEMSPELHAPSALLLRKSALFLLTGRGLGLIVRADVVPKRYIPAPDWNQNSTVQRVDMRFSDKYTPVNI